MIGRYTCCILVLIAFTSVGRAEDEPVAIHSNHGGQADFPALNYDSLWAGAVPLAESAEGQDLLERCVAAYGGEEHLRKLSGLKAEWIMHSRLGGDSVKVTRSFASGRRHRISIADPERPEVRILNGPEAWQTTGSQSFPLEGVRYKAELFSDYVLGLPMSMRDPAFAGARYLVRPEDSLKCILLDLPDSLWLVVGIDPGDHMIRRAEGVIRHENQKMVFVNLFDDFGRFSGYLFPQRLVNISVGLKVGESRLENLTVNPEFTAQEFTAHPAEESLH